mgnify:CR=1 FL=1
MLQFLQLIASGIAQGCIYGLIALGFVLIYKATETINFAQGDLMMLGGFLGLTGTLALGLPFWAAFAAALVVMLFFGMALERAVLRPLLGQPAFTVAATSPPCAPTPGMSKGTVGAKLRTRSISAG